ncbi:MAG: hypothetical protein ACLFQP_09220 [Halothece sp.]
MNLFFLTLTRKFTLSSDSEEGLTLLEVIASIVMISVILVAIAPPLLLTAATRVKMRRVSQAQLIAQEEVNRVQGIMARSRDENLPTEDDCDPTDSSDCTYVGLPETVDNLEDAEAPSSVNNLRRVDVDSDGEDDFLVQTFRNEGALFSGGEARCEPAIFQIGVRVYSILAEDNIGTDKLETDRISLQMTSGLQGQTTQPMAVISTEVSRSDMERSRDAYEAYLDDDGIPSGCP